MPPRVAKALDSYALLAALLAVPWAWLAFGYLTGRLFYGEMVHASGEWAIWCLMAALAVTPLRRLFPRQAWTAWLLPRRRYLGVAAFAYAALHTAVYVLRQGDLPRLLAEALEAGLLTGWLAFAIFVPLAITSNDASARRLGRGWKRLHRAVYAAAILSFVHWILVAFDPTVAYAHLGVLATLETIRLLPWARGLFSPAR
ncbi:MAG TPA: ferric reductase-like transmembrane domain-containing protein [Gammaproteobacteria bacterium]|nr:ferric reductase-like transmembrane domain-containing protein [Gammaproteobacteria bacterium]